MNSTAPATVAIVEGNSDYEGHHECRDERGHVETWHVWYKRLSTADLVTSAKIFDPDSDAHVRLTSMLTLWNRMVHKVTCDGVARAAGEVPHEVLAALWGQHPSFRGDSGES